MIYWFIYVQAIYFNRGFMIPYYIELRTRIFISYWSYYLRAKERYFRDLCSLMRSYTMGMIDVTFALLPSLNFQLELSQTPSSNYCNPHRHEIRLCHWNCKFCKDSAWILESYSSETWSQPWQRFLYLSFGLIQINVLPRSSEPLIFAA